MRKNKGNAAESFSFLTPWRLIKARHFTHKDVKNIKDNLVKSFSIVYLIVSFGLAFLLAALMVFMFINSKNKGSTIIDHYGLIGLVGQITAITCCLISGSLIIVSRSISNIKVSTTITRIAGDLLYFGASCYMLCCIFTDAEKGFTTEKEALSAGIIFIAILALIQPMYWVDAIILDMGNTFGIYGVSFYCLYKFGMKAIEYYILIATVFPLACYLVISLLFYAESQRYREILENEKLHNHAYYDKLTHCKNRYALSDFLKENKSRWENNDSANLLLIIFDIDDFKLYNDQFSHLGGDYCLRSICDAVRQEFPSPSLDFFRFGGEEFLLFFELKDPNEAPHVMERVRTAISKLEIIAPNGAPKKMVTVSLGGLFMKNIKTFDFEEKMKIADAYLYQAKRSGKDVACYNGTIIN